MPCPAPIDQDRVVWSVISVVEADFEFPGDVLRVAASLVKVTTVKARSVESLGHHLGVVTAHLSERICSAAYWSMPITKACGTVPPASGKRML